MPTKRAREETHQFRGDAVNGETLIYRKDCLETNRCISGAPPNPGLDGRSTFTKKRSRKNNALICEIMQFSGDYQNLNVKKALDLRTVIVAVNFGHHCGLLTSKI